MGLDAIGPDKLMQIYENSVRTTKFIVRPSLILVDGTIIYPAWEDFNTSEKEYKEGSAHKSIPPHHVEVRYKKAKSPTSRYAHIPAKKIAGVASLNHEQKKIDSDTSRIDSDGMSTNWYDGSFYESLAYCTYDKLTNDYDFKTYGGGGRDYAPYTDVEYFDWNDEVEYEEGTLLYADLGYFDRIAKVSQIGFGIFGFSFSVGGERDIAGFIEKKMTGQSIPLNRISDHDEVLVSGHPHLIQDIDNEVIEKKIGGSIWRPYLLTDTELDNIEKPDPKRWVICWFNPNSFIIPQDWAFETPESVEIFGEVVNMPLETEYGDVEYCIKARAAGT
jgi:hypothetical protein